MSAAALATTGDRVPAATNTYFVNPLVDALAMGAVSIAVFALLRLSPAMATSPRLATITTVLVWGVAYPHFAATNARLYGSSVGRAQFPLTAALTPLIFLGAALACFASPKLVAPAFVKLFQLWSPYHFSGQTLGLTVLYARRSGFALDGHLRRALTVFIYSTFLFGSARAEALPKGGTLFGVHYPSLGLDPWVPRAMAVVVWVSATVVALLLLERRSAGRGAMPWIVVLPAVTQCVWFTTTPIASYIVLAFVFHSLQYLFVAWNLRLTAPLPPSAAARSREAALAVVTARWMATNVVAGYVMFWLMPKVMAPLGASLTFSTAVVVVAFQTHHFFVDGVIWKMRSAELRAGLSSSWAQLVRTDHLQ